MTQPGQQPEKPDWEDIAPRRTDAPKVTERVSKEGTAKARPFAVGHPVDGYAFTRDPESPELRYQRRPKAELPATPRRELPKRIRDQVPGSGVWQPGGPARIEQPQAPTTGPNVVQSLLFALIPLALLAGGVYLVIRLYQ